MTGGFLLGATRTNKLHSQSKGPIKKEITEPILTSVYEEDNGKMEY